MRVKITGGRVIDPANRFDKVADIYIANGVISALGACPDGFTADQEINAAEHIVCPGLVDLRARLREPGHEHKGTILSETSAAARGGITTLCCPPDTDPVIDTPAVVELIRQRTEQAGKCRVVTKGALTQNLKGKKLSEMHALKQAGCVGVTNAFETIENTQVMRRAMEYATSFDITVFLHSEDPWLRNSACMHEGKMSARLGLPGIPESAETIAVARDLLLVEQTGVTAHFCQLTTARAVQMIATSQQEGLPITVDVAVHQLHLTDMDVGFFNSYCHTRPPLRSQRDRDGLVDGLKQGTVTAICSDHQPHDIDAKLAPFEESEAGISALETLLALSLKIADQHNISLSDILGKLTTWPAKILGIDAGTLGVGRRADVCIFDPNQYWTLSADEMISHGHNTPFLNWEFKGQVVHTLLEGKIVYSMSI